MKTTTQGKHMTSLKTSFDSSWTYATRQEFDRYNSMPYFPLFLPEEQQSTSFIMYPDTSTSQTCTWPWNDTSTRSKTRYSTTKTGQPLLSTARRLKRKTRASPTWRYYKSCSISCHYVNALSDPILGENSNLSQLCIEHTAAYYNYSMHYSLRRTTLRNWPVSSEYLSECLRISKGHVSLWQVPIAKIVTTTSMVLVNIMLIVNTIATIRAVNIMLARRCQSIGNAAAGYVRKKNAG
ncbi:hypothetical protein F4813DRAFT_280386 [Daldinia decipiens]|uniref:uncharacterized protein n=1 Tax=Daldinia decipiens TaxID=326647 RepID=UPI0020C34145|nr:uncharacterized protein F4813DRAFT_280386 [Daldinia decipiens]KAI1653194.1 hypothetical protein F4813DRAFT_280386 [Daldinia decipiens]